MMKTNNIVEEDTPYSDPVEVETTVNFYAVYVVFRFRMFRRSSSVVKMVNEKVFKQHFNPFDDVFEA